MKKEKMPMGFFSYEIPSKDIKISKKYLASDGWRWYIDVADYGYVISNAPGYESYTKDGYKNDLGYEKNFEEAYQWLLETCKRNDWTLKEIGTSEEEIDEEEIDEECEEPTKYLKWEDLEINKSVKVNLNGTQGVVTLLSFSSTYGKNPCYEAEICLQNNYGKDYIIRLRKEESTIFDNLHLEVVD